MERSSYLFPLPVHSSHHSHYHRFQLGADPAVLDPFPKPHCLGALAGVVGGLSQRLDLQKWRKLYHGAFPWVDGFGPEHYRPDSVPPHCPLPRPYCRPARRFAAYDFVLVADPSVSALALVAGDRRVIEGFTRLGGGFCSLVEAGAGARQQGPGGSRHTGRLLAGQFYEPNNRWLMPFLHVHTRVLNFTSFAEAPARLACLDAGALARAGERAMGGWAKRQAQMLSGLGYRVTTGVGAAAALRVDGVCEGLLAAMEAPRIAVLRILERLIGAGRPAAPQRLWEELPAPVVAAMAEQIEGLVAKSLSYHKPPKVGIPSEGPWRAAVREHLSTICPDALARIDAAAARAGAVKIAGAILPCPQLDRAHVHAPELAALESRMQSPTDPELGVAPHAGACGGAALPWLALDFQKTLLEVNEQLVRFGPAGPLAPMRAVLSALDGLTAGADHEQLRQAGLLVGAEIERQGLQRGAGPVPAPDAASRWRGSLASLDELFEFAHAAPAACVREMGGRSL